MLTKYFQSLSVNGQIIVEQPSSSQYNLVLQGNSSTFNVFQLDTSQLQSVTNSININVPSNSYAIINLVGSSNYSPAFKGLSFGSTTDYNHILWSVDPIFTTIEINATGFIGSILSTADVYADNGRILGSVYANSLHGGIEVHNFIFTPYTPYCPPC